MHCMMTEFLGDWPKPKTLDRRSLGPLRRSSGEAGDTEPGPGASFCSCESIPARAERAPAALHLPCPGSGTRRSALLAWVESTIRGRLRRCRGVGGGTDTCECARGSSADPPGSRAAQPVCGAAAELPRAPKIPHRCRRLLSGTGMGLPCPRQPGWKVWLEILPKGGEGRGGEGKPAGMCHGVALSKILMHQCFFFSCWCWVRQLCTHAGGTALLTPTLASALTPSCAAAARCCFCRAAPAMANPTLIFLGAPR